MKRLCLSTVLGLLMVISSAFAEEIIPSRITEVTLFSGEALVKRGATATVQKGLQEFLIEVEAFSMDKDSVSAKVFGAGEVYGVQFKEVAVQESPQDKIRDLEQKIKDLKHSSRVLSDQRDVLSKKEKFLESLLAFAEMQVSKDIQTHFPKIEDLNKTLDFLGSQIEKIHKGRQALDLKLEAIDEQRKMLERELESLGRDYKKVRKFLEIVFNSSRDQTITFETSYISRNAGWEPLYKVAVPPSLNTIDLTMFARIRQKTGEDWTNVAVSLSNVIPLRGVTPPEPSPWTLDIPRYKTSARIGAGPMVMEKALQAPAADSIEEGVSEPHPEGEAAIAVARMKELPFSFEYEIPRRMTIESRDKETMLPLFDRNLKGECFHYVVPQRSPLTFLVCEAKADKELLSGPLNVYFSGRYVGKTYLMEKKAGEAFRVNLGADREVKVSRVKLRDKVKETFFGNIERDTIVREFAYKLTQENLKNNPVQILLLDSIPISRTDKIKVKDIKMNPEPTERNYRDREGVMLWNNRLEPGENSEVTIEFVVTYPKDAVISGL